MYYRYKGKTSFGLTYNSLSYEAIRTDEKRYKIRNSEYLCIVLVFFKMNIDIPKA